MRFWLDAPAKDLRLVFDAVAYINAPRNRRVSLGLERIALLMQYLGDPQDKLKCIHVAGTNGKGSTCAYIDSVLRCAGYKCGLFTSPFIEKFEERIKVNGEDIDSDSLCKITLLVKKAAERVKRETGEHPTEFELMTAVAFVYFFEQKCDICTIEVGLGGRYDSTNIIDPLVSVITPISKDHTKVLGDTIEQIAFEKAGIIKKSTPVIVAPQNSEALEVIKKVCEEKHYDEVLHCIDNVTTDFRYNESGEQIFEYKNCEYATSLLGSYQPENARTAIEVIHVLKDIGWEISQSNIKKGIKTATWQGRFEVFENARNSGKTVIVDGAHNTSGAKELTTSLQKYISAKKIKSPHLSGVFGVLEDKDYEAIIESTEALFDEFFIYEPNSPRALNTKTLEKCLVARNKKVTACKNAKSALEVALSSTKKADDIIVCFGSLYSVGEIRNSLV